MLCPCGSQTEFSNCCEIFLNGTKLPETPEQLMRSRYTAFATGNEPYIRETLAPEARHDYNKNEVLEWAKKSEWVGLQIIKASGDTVEFLAKYKTQGKVLEHHEVAKFKKYDGKWLFVDGDAHVHEEGKGHHHHEPKAPVVRDAPKLGRNDPCSCGSGKKFKKCCGA